ncbi:MAG: hypothetical protein KF761_07100 [Salinibacterium sp.]|nr:hypothetical protein [Salinibacterium sp.]
MSRRHGENEARPNSEDDVMTVPTPDEVRAFVTLQIEILHGHQVRAGGLGPLAGVHVVNGEWRARGTHDARRILSQGLAHWADSPDAGAYRNGRSADTAVTALKAAWGISRPPADFDSAGAIVGVDRRTINTWHRRVIGSRVFAQWLEEQPLVGAPASLPRNARPHRHISWVDWPHPEDATEFRASAGKYGIAAGLSHADLAYALRQAVSAKVSAYCQTTSSAKLARTIGKTILPKWKIADPHLVALPEGVMEGPGGGGAELSATAILQMFAYGVVTDDFAALREELELRALSRTSLVIVSTGPSAPNHLHELTEDELKAIGTIPGRMAVHVSDESAAKAIEFLKTDELLPTEAPKASELIRFLDRQMQGPLIDHYIELRQRVMKDGRPSDPNLDEFRGQGSPSPQAAADALYALADQGIRLETVHGKNSAQLERFDELHDGQPYDRGYGGLAMRDPGLAKSKAGNHRDGIFEMLRALEMVVERGVQSDHHREIERLEEVQQIELSVCGAYVTLLENHLMTTMSRGMIHHGVSEIASAALAHSHASLGTLASIRTKYGGELQAKREADGRHIASVSWIETVYKNRLRALIATRTAFEAGLLLGAEFEGESHDFGLDSLHNLYRAIIGLPRIQDPKGLGMQGTWLAMLNKGELPYLDSGSSSLMSISFLDADPEDPPASDIVELDVLHSASWHRERRDRGTLGRIRPGSCAWRALEETSGRRYSAWLSALGDLEH